MTPLVIESCDFVRIRLKAGQTTYFFKTAGALTGKKISTISVPVLGYNGGSIAMIDPTRVYITLIDIEGDILFNNTPAILFSSGGFDLPQIDRVIDWERSYIKIMDNDGLNANVSLDDLSFFANIFVSANDKPGLISGSEKYYTVPLEVPVGTLTKISLRNKVTALSGRKIKGLVIFTQLGAIHGYISLYPYDRNRFIEYLELSNIILSPFPVLKSEVINNEFVRHCIPSYIDPVEIDFDRSEIEIIKTQDIINPEIVFIYE